LTNESQLYSKRERGEKYKQANFLTERKEEEKSRNVGNFASVLCVL